MKAGHGLGNNKILGIILKFHKLIVFLVILVGFFVFYNAFLIDRALENLRFCFRQTSLAYNIKDLEGLDIIFTDALLDEFLSTEPHLDSKGIIGLEYASNIATRGSDYRQIEHMKVVLDNIVRDKEKKRGLILTGLDKINTALKGLAGKALGFFRPASREDEAEPSGEVDLSLYEKARELEKEGKLQEAAAYYSEFVGKFPSHEKIALVKLRLAYSYHRLGEADTARALYRELTRFHFATKEANIARILLFKLEQRKVLAKRRDELLLQSAETIGERERQNLYYQLGVVNTKLLDLTEANKFFKRSMKGELAGKASLKPKFISAWIDKSQKNIEESLAKFMEIVHQYPDNVLAFNSSYQIADIYHKEGRYEEAIDIFMEIANSHKNEADIASLCTFQAGASYMYDLNEEEKAQEIFKDLSKKYPETPYADYLTPQSPIGIFVTYLVPRATRVVAWRSGGLLCLTGYSGEICNFKVELREKAFMQAFNHWLRKELPDTVGNLYVDIKGAEIDFEKDSIAGSGRIIMGKFSVAGESEARLELGDDGALNVIITKAFLEKIPIPPLLINNSLTGISYIVKRHFPIIVKNVAMKKDELLIEGVGSKRMLERMRESTRELLGIEIFLKDVRGHQKQQEVYTFFKEKYPESNFSPEPKDDIESLFLDFFTRVYLYLGFKLLETTKDSKFDYERSVRTLGKLIIKKGRFGITYSDDDINIALSRLISSEFPWIMSDEFLVDVKGLEIHFKKESGIEFNSFVGLSFTRNRYTIGDYVLSIDGKADLIIDEESKIPRIVFKEFLLNGTAFPLEKLNLVTERCLSLLKDGRIPLSLASIEMEDGRITLKGEGAKDFTARVFSDPYLFVIFQIREDDLWAAGIERRGDRPIDPADYWRGRSYGYEHESTIGGSEMGSSYR